MRALLSTYGSRGNVEPVVELAVQMRATGADGCDAPGATWMLAAGMRR